MSAEVGRFEKWPRVLEHPRPCSRSASMTEKNSGPEKPTDERAESADLNTDADTSSGDLTSPTEIEADLGASALLELDTVDVEQGTVTTRTLTVGDGEPFGIELGVTVGPAHTEAVLDAEATAALAGELDEAVETLRERGAL